MELGADGESVLVREIIDVFLSDTQEKVDSLQKAVLDPDLAGAQRIAHSLKGAAKQLEILQLAEDAERLESSSAEIDGGTLSLLVLTIVEGWREAKQSIIDPRESLSDRQV